jgi:hypothetical protein
LISRGDAVAGSPKARRSRARCRPNAGYFCASGHACLVVEHADFDDAVRGPRGAREQSGQSEQKIAAGGRNGIGLPQHVDKRVSSPKVYAFQEVPAIPIWTLIARAIYISTCNEIDRIGPLC